MTTKSPPKPATPTTPMPPPSSPPRSMPLTDVESVMRETRVIAHQATGGAQTPWQADQPLRAAVHLPAQRRPRAGSGGRRRPCRTRRRRSAASTLKALTGPRCGATTSPTTRPISPLSERALRRAQGGRSRICSPCCSSPIRSVRRAPRRRRRRSIAGPACPDGFYAQGGFDEAYCAPLAPPPVLVCPPGFASIPTDDGMGCAPFLPPPILVCPPRFHPIDRRYCRPDIPPPFCPPGFRPVWHDGLMACVRNGPPPPICPFGTHPVWNGAGYVCGGNPPPPIPCPNGQPNWRDGRWSCLPAAALCCRRRDPAVDQRQDDLRRVPLARRTDALPAWLHAVARQAAIPPASRPAVPAPAPTWRRRSSGRRLRPRRT